MHTSHAHVLGRQQGRLRLQQAPAALIATAVVSSVALVVAAVGLVIADDRITGVAAWLKPAKFAISILIYAATLAWLLTLVEGRRRLVSAAAVVTGAALIGELVLIDMQVVRGTTSHFNDDSAFDSGVFTVMGALIGAVFVATLVVAVLLLRQGSLVGPLATGIRAGIWVALLGMAEAGLMLANRSWHSGGGHTVGALDGGPGLPIVGWSTEYGDLRVAHFAGIHALQVLPVVALAVRRWARPDVARDLVRLAGVTYAGLVILLAWEAERQVPVSHPDPATVGAALGGLALAAASGLLIHRRSRTAVA